MNTAFSHALRVVLCPSCGEPVTGPTSAGEARCGACQTALSLGERRAREASSALEEAERLTRLADQDGARLVPTAVVKELVVDGELPEERVADAMALWQATRAQIGDGEESDDLERRFYFLTRLLYERRIEKEDELGMRAILETAIETSRSSRYRQTFRCMLACEAARGGDPVSAEAWLEPCDARSTDIHADSVYRYAFAYVASHQRQWAKVIDVLGATHEDVPMAVAFDGTCSVLRANAHERRQDVAAAVDELAAAMKRLPGGVDDVDQVLRTAGALKLCRRSYGPARKRIGQGGAEGSMAPAAGARMELREVLPWTVLSLACFGLAVGLPAGVSVGGVRADVLLVVSGILLAVPIGVAVRRGRS